MEMYYKYMNLILIIFKKEEGQVSDDDFEFIKGVYINIKLKIKIRIQKYHFLLNLVLLLWKMKILYMKKNVLKEKKWKKNKNLKMY